MIQVHFLCIATLLWLIPRSNSVPAFKASGSLYIIRNERQTIVIMKIVTFLEIGLFSNLSLQLMHTDIS